MRRVFQIVCFLSVVLPLCAQIPPEWYNADFRRNNFPAELYYTGFIKGLRQSGETTDDAISRIKNEARVELASSIRTTVEHSMQNSLSSDLRQSSTDFEEDVRELHMSSTRISSNIKDIPGLKVDIYQNPKNGEIAAFAYVKRSTLLNQLIKSISLGLGKAESAYDMANQLLEEGQKTQARKYAESGMGKISEIEEAQVLLSAIDENAEEETLQLEAAKEIKRNLTQMVNQLRNALSIYIQCDSRLFGYKYTALLGEIRGDLSKMGVSFVSNPENADWAIYIIGSTREHKKSDFGSSSNYAAWADIDLTIVQIFTNKEVYSNRFSKLGNHTFDFENAARDAYEKVKPEIIDAIKEQIQQ